MYLHLGQNVVVRQCDVVGIFDIENTTVQRISKDFLAKAQRQGQVINVSPELPKAFIVCQRGKETMVYISQISSVTLKKRTQAVRGMDIRDMLE